MSRGGTQFSRTYGSRDPSRTGTKNEQSNERHIGGTRWSHATAPTGAPAGSAGWDPSRGDAGSGRSGQARLEQHLGQRVTRAPHWDLAEPTIAANRVILLASAQSCVDQRRVTSTHPIGLADRSRAACGRGGDGNHRDRAGPRKRFVHFASRSATGHRRIGPQRDPTRRTE